MKFTVIGAGLAGTEAAWQIANAGHPVTLLEMKPVQYSPAHTSPLFAELVCSNSLKAARLESAAGLLKEEMARLGSLTVPIARQCAVPAGGALAVDREQFASRVTAAVEAHPNITVEHRVVTEVPRGADQITVVASGPLTADDLASDIERLCPGRLSFYDAAAPIVSAESIDFSKAFYQTRYDKGEADYVNCPMDRDEYQAFYDALVTAESAPLKEFDRPEESAGMKVFEGCMPVEVLAKRGFESVRYGCMKPVGLTDPRTGKRPYAVVQLRKENKDGTMYNLVGFQTNLKFGEQKRVFSMIPGLENAEFVRYGVMHRNTFLDSPRLLDKWFMLRGSDNVFFGGQMTGVEGYVESAASGIIAGRALADRLSGKTPLELPHTTMLGALCSYISDPTVENFQPMASSMGILPGLDRVIKGKQERYAALAQRALSDLDRALSDSEDT